MRFHFFYISVVKDILVQSLDICKYEINVKDVPVTANL